ncbi:MAG TPA: hypothetical protein VGP73_13025 [Thermoanaerobaculia bacterium]
MSQHVRRSLAALGLMAALLFAAPAPSRAAGLWEIPVLAPEAAARVRTWLEGWLLPASPRRAAPARTKQGSALDPNGSTTTSPTSGSTSDQGSALDPNGTK